MVRKRRRMPVSVLRSRLDERFTRLEDCNSAYGKGEGNNEEAVSGGGGKMFFWTFSLGFLRSINKGFHLKMVIALSLVLIIGFAKVFGAPYANQVVDGVDKVIGWNMDTTFFKDKVIPSIKNVSQTIPAIGDFQVEDAGGNNSLLPVSGDIISGYGVRQCIAGDTEEMHYGIDIVASRGAVVKNLFSGNIAAVERMDSKNRYRVIVTHDLGWETIYEGLSEIKVRAGQEVDSGNILGVLRDSELWDEPHLHFEIRRDGSPANPEKILGLMFDSTVILQ